VIAMKLEREIVVPMSDVMKGVTVTIRVTGESTFKARWYAASWLLRLAALVAGCGIRIEGSREGHD